MGTIDCCGNYQVIVGNGLENGQMNRGMGRKWIEGKCISDGKPKSPSLSHSLSIICNTVIFVLQNLSENQQ